MVLFTRLLFCGSVCLFCDMWICCCADFECLFVMLFCFVYRFLVLCLLLCLLGVRDCGVLFACCLFDLICYYDFDCLLFVWRYWWLFAIVRLLVCCFV